MGLAHSVDGHRHVGSSLVQAELVKSRQQLVGRAVEVHQPSPLFVDGDLFGHPYLQNSIRFRFRS